jgi:hypothetical protein
MVRVFLPLDGSIGIVRPVPSDASIARRASYLCSAFPKGEWTRRRQFAPNWVRAEREPDNRRENAKTASPIKERATIRQRLPAVRGGQQAATGRRASRATAER